MRIRLAQSAHLTYCTNIHPGETWTDTFANVRERVGDVKRRLAPREPFGVGLRLSERAARDLETPATLRQFRSYLDEHGLYVFTINGFPYGEFHSTRIKEEVYRPDWLERERPEYTDRLGRILCALLPREKGTGGSISTVPGCFRTRCMGDGDRRRIADHFLQSMAPLARMRADGHPRIVLAIEPEPACVIETTAEGIEFIQTYLFARPAVQRFAELTGLSAAAAEQAIHEHVGLCFDACHAAVEFEDADASLSALVSAGVQIAKIQLSSGLVVDRPDRDKLEALRAYADEVYLHQVVTRRGDSIQRFTDLPAALEQGPGAEEWRIHFHVPLFHDALGPFRTTQPFVESVLARLRREALCEHLEIETYTWNVLPAHLRTDAVESAIAREIEWVVAHAQGA